LILPAAAASSAQAAAIFTAGIYSQDFNSMGIAGTAAPTDWLVGTLGGTFNRVTDGGGTATSVALTVDNGSNGTAGLSFNFGTTGDADRAVGNNPTTASGDRVIQLALNNNTGAPITDLIIGYTGEQWRQSQGISSSGVEKLRLYYSLSPNSGWVSISSLDWTAPKQGAANAALDGNAAANRNVLSATFTPGAAIPDATNFYLRWLDWNDNGTNDHGLAIDDVSITAVSAPEPSSLAFLALGGFALLRRRRRA
jgi:hypothetical protein